MTGARGRRRYLWGIVPGVLLVVAIVATVIVSVRHQSTRPRETAFRGSTASITRGDLQTTVTAVGTLAYTGTRTLSSGIVGILTNLPASKSVLRRDDELFDVDDMPVVLLRGALPAWREFAKGMSDGPDVAQLERNLARLGFFGGYPDDEFTGLTVAAIKQWQGSHDLARTGRIPLGGVVFSRGNLRVGALTAAVGDRIAVGSPLYEVSNTTQQVSASVSLDDQQVAVVGHTVVVRLSDGTQINGRIVSVGTPTEVDRPTGGKQTVLPTTITIGDSKTTRSFQQASVTVDIPGDRRAGVLSAPVAALLALDARRFAVEVVGADGATRKVPVTTGLFAAGRVQISGSGLAAGQRVVVPGQ